MRCFSRLMLGSMMFLGIALTACDAPAEPGDSNLPGSAATGAVPSVEEAVPMEEGGEGVPDAPLTSDVPPPSRAVFADAECSFEDWVGKPVDEAAIKETGRIYRILTPDAMMTMDHNPDRINVVHDKDKVTRVWCG